jgi:hypothetical protein
MPDKLTATYLSTIHNALLSTDNDTDASILLGVHPKTLQEFLKNCRINDLHLSTQTLKTISREEGLQRFGTGYDQPLCTYFSNIKQYSIAFIHSLCQRTENIAEAADQLYVSVKFLQYHLKQITLDGIGFDYNKLKYLSAEQAEVLWGVMYHTPIMPEAMYTEPHPQDIAYLQATLEEEQPSAHQSLSMFKDPFDARLSESRADNHQPNSSLDAAL